MIGDFTVARYSQIFLTRKNSKSCKFYFLFSQLSSIVGDENWISEIEEQSYLLGPNPLTALLVLVCLFYIDQWLLTILFHYKVHGGTTYEDIEQKVRQAEDMARENQNKKIDTVLFFDEANTTEALSMIKEVMVDRRVRGQPIGRGLERLQFIAACNPYRR